jgi:PAS domain S-box-containing protein
MWNPFMERMTGLPSGEVLGKHPLELLPFLGESGAYGLIEKALRGEESTALDLPYLVPQTGKTGWCDGDFVPLRDERGEIAGAIVTVRNVTERKRREEELHQLSSRLLQLQDEERRRIARDLHDSTAQILTALSLTVASLQNDKELVRSPRAQKLLDGATKLAQDASNEIRNLSHLLHPPDLDAVGLIAAVEWHCGQIREMTGIHITVECPPDLGRLPRDIEIALFRIVQESLENVRRHSGSLVAGVRLVREHKAIILEIKDQGRGVPPGILADGGQNTAHLGVGLAGMRERVRQLGGHLQIASSDRGTIVTANVPIPEVRSEGGLRQQILAVTS